MNEKSLGKQSWLTASSVLHTRIFDMWCLWNCLWKYFPAQLVCGARELLNLATLKLKAKPNSWSAWNQGGKSLPHAVSDTITIRSKYVYEYLYTQGISKKQGIQEIMTYTLLSEIWSLIEILVKHRDIKRFNSLKFSHSEYTIILEGSLAWYLSWLPCLPCSHVQLVFKFCQAFFYVNICTQPLLSMLNASNLFKSSDLSPFRTESLKIACLLVPLLPHFPPITIYLVLTKV